MSVNALIPPSHCAPVDWDLHSSLCLCLPSFSRASSPLAYDTLPKQSNKLLRNCITCLLNTQTLFVSLFSIPPPLMLHCILQFLSHSENTSRLSSFLQLVCLQEDSNRLSHHNQGPKFFLKTEKAMQEHFCYVFLGGKKKKKNCCCCCCCCTAATTRRSHKNKKKPQMLKTSSKNTKKKSENTGH